MIKEITLSILTAMALNATTITGIGYADLSNEAKKEALGDLSHKISVDVQSDFKSITSSMGKEYQKSNEKLLHLSSNLPILGVSFQELVDNTLVKSTATLDSMTAINLYTLELKRLRRNIEQSILDIETTKDDTLKYEILNQLLNDVENFNKHKIVATLLKATNLPLLSITKSEIRTKLHKYIQNTPSLKIASMLLSKNITQSNIYISAIRVNGSKDITQFAKLLKSEISTQLDTVKIPSKAIYFLRGRYEILKDKIFISTTLSDRNNKILQTNTVSLQASAYENTHYKPRTKTFDASLNSEYIKSDTLSVQVGFRGYNRTDGIDLYKGDKVDIIIKTNKPICYFLLGHTLKENDKFSQVLPIGSDNSPFINRITGDDVNKNISIADDVPIASPYGSENLQVFASTFTKKGTCPLVVPNTDENKDGYFVIQGKPTKVVSQTRALNMSQKRLKVEKSEASISFTSFER